MATKPVQIQKETPPHQSMDFFFLREEGIRLVQELSGKIWTDYNPHDPGVTILEQLCYALADLGFRTDFKIQDLLNARSRNQRKALNSTFFDASEILPTNPVSVIDYRKIIIDQVQAVKNAWVEPVFDNLQGIKGLYRVTLQVDESAREDSEKDRIKAEVFALFNEHRNLCEDIESIEILNIDKITIFADLDISSDIVPEEALAEILFKLEEHLNPSIRYYTIEELVAEGYEIDEIFDGPVPMHGIIKSEDLRPMRQEVYISKIIEIISSVEGVRRINFFRVEKDGFPVEGDLIRIEEKTYPVLDMDTIDERWKKNAYPIRFQRGNLNYELDLNTANQLLYSLYARYKKGYQMKMLYNERDYPSVLKLSDIPRYFSVQNTFPGTYGLGRYGLPNNVRATRERTAMIKQLKGYLVFFEQMMANYLAQLSNIKSLFSLDEKLDKTYFSQIPEDIPGLRDIINSKDNESFQKKLEEVMSEFDPYLDRRNRILDHLLARFGEQFTTDFLVKVSQYVGFGFDQKEKAPEQDLIEAKIDFLKNYVDISRNRSKGFNYLALHHVIHQQELDWADIFEALLKQYETEEEKDVIRQQFLQLRKNYSARQHQKDFFSMALNYKVPENIVILQNNILLEGLDLPEQIVEQLKEVNLGYAKKAKEILAMEVAGLEKRVCMLLHVIQSGNESLLRIFENADDFDGLEEFNDIIELASPALPEGYLDLDAELQKLKAREDAIKEQAEKREVSPEDLLNEFLHTDEDGGFIELPVQDDEETDKELDELKDDLDDLDDLENLDLDIDDDSRNLDDDEIDELEAEEEKLPPAMLDDDVSDTLDYHSRFVFRAQQMDELMIDLLSNGLFSHNYIVLPRRKGDEEVYAIYYRGNKHLGCVKVREVTTRLAARMEIERVIKYLNQVNQHTEGMHVVEHVLLRPQAQDRHGFRLVNDQDRILLESYELGSFEEQRIICNQLDLVAAKKDNYEIRQETDGSFTVLLKDNNAIIARCPEIFYTLEGAQEKMEDLLDYVNSFKSGAIALQNNISFFLEERRDADVNNDFYTLSMSVILPAWPSRFQNDDFRALLCNVFCINAPVHVDIQFYWLEVSEMRAFEQCYFDWLEERNSLYPNQPDLDDKALSVAEFLQKIQQASKK